MSASVGKVLALSVALLVGYSIRTAPEDPAFSSIFSISSGYLPQSKTLGGYRPCPNTPEVPMDMSPLPAQATTLTLPGTGDKLPQSGMAMTCHATHDDADSVRRYILWYLVLGGRHIDTAQEVFGNHKKMIGQAVKDAVEKFGIPRSEIFVTASIPKRNFGYFSTIKAIPVILQELGLDYLDMLLIHAPTTTSSECKDNRFSATECLKTTWKAMTVAKRKGLVRNVGGFNLNKKQLSELQIIDRAPIAVNQIAVGAGVSESQVQQTHMYCEEHGIHTVTWSSLAGSSLSSGSEKLSREKALKNIAFMHNKTEAQVLLRWSMQKGNAIMHPIVGSLRNMAENLDVYDFALVEEEVAMIDTLQSKSKSSKSFIFAPPSIMS